MLEEIDFSSNAITSSANFKSQESSADVACSIECATIDFRLIKDSEIPSSSSWNKDLIRAMRYILCAGNEYRAILRLTEGKVAI